MSSVTNREGGALAGGTAGAAMAGSALAGPAPVSYTHLRAHET